MGFQHLAYEKREDVPSYGIGSLLGKFIHTWKIDQGSVDHANQIFFEKAKFLNPPLVNSYLCYIPGSHTCTHCHITYVHKK